MDTPPRKPTRSSRNKLKEERKRMMTEMAAAAYVRMKHGDYRFPDGVRKGARQEDGTYINKSELMRIAGYNIHSNNTHYEYLENDEYYQQMIALHERRYNDPMFRDEQVSTLWETVGNEALRNIYEQLTYYPHNLTVEQLVKIVNMVLGAGLTLKKIGQEDEKSKAADLIESIKDPKQREAVRENYRQKLKKELDELDV